MNKTLKKMVIFGAQGSGKGTQAEILSKKFGMVYISTGNIFRKEMDRKTRLGKRVLNYIQKGRLVPDGLTNKIIEKRINKKDAKKSGFILDGYPRNRSQMNFLNKIAQLTDVLVIEISDKEAIHRISGRRACVCGRTYHIIYNPPRKKGICDSCSRKLFFRDDDKPKAISKRLSIYHKETEPLFVSYQKKGILRKIDGEKSIPQVHRLAVRALGLPSF